MGTALAFAAQLLELIQLLSSAGQAVTEVATWGSQQVQMLIDEGRDPTADEWATLNARIKSLREQIHRDDV
jgi:hypothetical protein